MSDRPLTFVVGTGRCGSTALSNIVNQHPDVLSLNELLSSIGTWGIPDEQLSGQRFWRLLADPHPHFNAMIRGGVPLPEFLYPRSPGRFTADDGGIPALSLMVLPHLTNDPDGLFDELASQVPSWPVRSARQHYRQLFDWLCVRFGRQVVLERSGYSLHWIPVLRARFPDAKFVHMYRDGPDCALSMSRHTGLRVNLVRHRIIDRLGIESTTQATPEDIASLPPELAGFFSGQIGPELVWQELPLAEFGAMWAEMIVSWLPEFFRIPEAQRTSLAYEDLLDDPKRELDRLAQFLGVEPNESWLEAGSSRLEHGSRGAALGLSPNDLALLREACLPGTRALGRAES